MSSKHLLPLFLVLFLGCSNSSAERLEAKLAPAGQSETPNILKTPRPPVAIDPIDSSTLAKPLNSGKHFFAFGGGLSPMGSQAVLELNMKIFSDLANAHGYSSESIHNLFGAGNIKDILDVQFLMSDLSHTEKRLASIMSEYVHDDTDAQCSYRHNELINLKGSSDRANVLSMFDYFSRSLSHAAHNTLRVYFTGHGFPTHTKEEHVTYDKNNIGLWNRTSMDVETYVSAMDKIDPKVQVQTIMVQCFSGGFAQMNHVGGNMENSLSKHNRCGFFAQVPDLESAGCTPDVLKREEYSSYFFSAYRGETEDGFKINADYNRDGQITSDEAHAYTVIHEYSIDIPTTTSSHLLREIYSEIPEIALTFRLSDIFDEMNLVEKATARGLLKHFPKFLSLDKLTLKDLKKHSHELHAHKHLPSYEKFAEKYFFAQEYFEPLKSEIKNKFDFLSRTFDSKISPSVAYLSEAEKQTAIDAMTAHPQFEAYDLVKAQLDALDIEQSHWEKQERKLYRLRQLFGTKLREMALEGSTERAYIEKYKALKACEQASFF